MVQKQVGFSIHRYIFPLSLLWLVATLPACGQLTHSSSSPLEVRLSLPEGEEPALFWYGVAQQSLRVQPESGEASVFTWQAGAESSLALRKGDRITFLGTDRSGRTVVTGEAQVGEEKKVSIPLRRLL